MMILVKRYVSKFLSFYLLKRDYQRLRCIQRLDVVPSQQPQQAAAASGTLQSQNSPTNLMPSGVPTALRRMNHEEIVQVYWRTIKTNLKLYHPIIGLAPARVFSCLRESLSLPKRIILSISLATAIFCVTISLALTQGICSDNSTQCYSSHKGTVTILDAAITAIIMIFLTVMASRNYLDFLEAVKYPYLTSHESVEIMPQIEQAIGSIVNNDTNRGASLRNQSPQLASESGVTPDLLPLPKPNSSQSSQRASRQNSLKKSTALNLKLQDSVTSGALATTQGGPQGPYLYSIKEDDEEAPLSPDKHSGRGLDDVGSDEVGMGKPKPPRDSIGLLPPLGLIKSVNQGDHYTTIIKLKTTNNIQVKGLGDNRQAMNNSFAKGNPSRLTAIAEHHNETYQRSKSISPAQSYQQDPYDGIHIEDLAEHIEDESSQNSSLNRRQDQKGDDNIRSSLLQQQKSMSQSVKNGKTSNGAGGPQGQLTNLYSRILKHAPTTAGEKFNEASTATHDRPFQITGPNFFKSHPQDLSIEDQNPTPKNSDLQRFQGISNPQSHFNTLRISTPDQQSSPQRWSFAMILSGFISVLIMLTPLYVVRQLSSLPNDQLTAILEAFIYAALLDLCALRLFLISVLSLIQVRLKLRGIGCMVPVRPPSSVLAEDQVMILGNFYESYDSAHNLLTEEGDTERGGDDNPHYSEDDENGHRSGDDGNFRSTTRKLLLNKKDSGLTKQRVHSTQCPQIFLLELMIPPEKSQLKPTCYYIEQEALAYMTPDENGIEIGFQGNGIDIEENNHLSNTSNRQLAITRAASSNLPPISTPHANLNGSYTKAGTINNISLSLKNVSNRQQDVSFKKAEINSSNEEDIEEIGNLSSLPRERMSMGQPGNQSRVPPINMALVPITPQGQASSTAQPQQVFETPKKSPGKSSLPMEGNIANEKGSQKLPSKKSGPLSTVNQPSTKSCNQVQRGYSKQMTGSKQAGQIQQSDSIQQQIDPDGNQSLLDQKKKLLRELILEASSNETTKKDDELKKEILQDDFQSSLKKYLAEESAESLELDGNGNPVRVKKIKAPGILNDSDIQALWQQPSGTKNTFSPKYSSGNKSIHNPLQNGLAKQMPRVVPQPEDKQKTAFSNEEQEVSFKQNHQVRSSSHKTNLLISVLSQNRELEAMTDLNELVKGSSQKDKKRNNGFNSPQERNKTPPLEGSNAKRKICSSIVVKEAIKPVNVQRQLIVDNDNVRIQEEDGAGKPVTVNIQECDIQPVTQASSCQKISQVNFTSDLDKKPQDKTIETIVNNPKRQSEHSRITATPNASEDLQQQNLMFFGGGRASMPAKRDGNSRSPGSSDRVSLTLSQRKKQEEILRKNLSAQKMIGGDLYSIKESAEFASSIGLRSSSNFTKIQPSQINEKATPNDQYTMKFSSERNNRLSDSQSQSIHTFISAYPGGKMSNRLNIMSGAKKNGASEDTILEEKSLEQKMDDESYLSPSGSPPVVLERKSSFPPEKKIIPFSNVQDNTLIGEVSDEPPELAALRRAKRNMEIMNKTAFKPQSIAIPEAMQRGLDAVVNEKRYTSNIRPSVQSDVYKPKIATHHHRMASSQSNTRSTTKAAPPSTVFVPQYFDQFGVKQIIPKPVQPPPEYNLHLKQQEQIKQKREKKEIEKIMVEEQERELKKFLQLARQLRKGKDEKKILALMTTMKEQCKPMSLQAINELRMLELMNSPYSQSLQGMIRTIEQCLNIKEERPSTNMTKRRRKTGVREEIKSPTENGEISTEKLLQAFDTYNKRQEASKASKDSRNNQVLPVNSLQGSSQMSQMTLSRESSAEPSKRTISAANRNQRNGLHFRSKSGQDTISKRDGGGTLRSSSSRRKKRNANGDAVDIMDQSEGQAYESSSNLIFSQLQSRKDSASNEHSIEDGTQTIQRSSSIGVRQIPPSKTPTSAQNQGSDRRSSKKSGKLHKSSRLAKQGAGSSQPNSSSLLSPTGSGGGAQVRRVMQGMKGNQAISHYSSINQVLVEHEDEESEVTHRNQTKTIEVDLEKGVGSAQSSPVLQEIEEIVDAQNSPDK